MPRSNLQVSLCQIYCYIFVAWSRRGIFLVKPTTVAYIVDQTQQIRRCNLTLLDIDIEEEVFIDCDLDSVSLLRRRVFCTRSLVDACIFPLKPRSPGSDAETMSLLASVDPPSLGPALGSSTNYWKAVSTARESLVEKVAYFLGGGIGMELFVDGFRVRGLRLGV